MGIQLGALAAMAPSRRKDFARVIIRSLIAGNVACFMTACIAGISRVQLLFLFLILFASLTTFKVDYGGVILYYA